MRKASRSRRKKYAGRKKAKNTPGKESRKAKKKRNKK
jgi:hypothetical protein